VNGVPLNTVRDLLGHSSVGISLRYADAVRTRGLPRSVNLRSGQRDCRIYIGGRSIRP
jgi:hypothetical protein